MRQRYITADVFTDRQFGGNPLAVFPEADGLDDTTMQRIAAELNLSETVFVLPPTNAAHAARLRIFTPLVELPFAGHPTVGAAFVLAQTGQLDGDTAVFEEHVGEIRIAVQREKGRPVGARYATTATPQFGRSIPDAGKLAEVLGLDAEAVLQEIGRLPRAVSCGVPFLFVPLRDREALGKARVDLPLWKTRLAGGWAPHLYVFTSDVGESNADFRARMFAPAMGIAEDPATGAAATALAGYLVGGDNVPDGPQQFRIDQGIEMGRPSRIEMQCDKRDGRIVEIRIGGRCVRIAEGTLELPGV